MASTTMMRPLIQGRIPETAFQVVNGTAFGLAMLAAASRVFVRASARSRLHLDDYFLLAACVCLVASTILLFVATTAIYVVQDVSLNGLGALVARRMTLPQFTVELVFYQRMNWAYLALSWTAIFLVKAAFLAFFFRLVARLRPLRIYCIVVSVVTALVGMFAVSDGFITCSKLGLDSKCNEESQIGKALAIGTVAVVLDIVTDLLSPLTSDPKLNHPADPDSLAVLAIPVSLLWRVQIKPYQKLGLGIFLCLNVVMIVMAIARAAGIHYHDSFDSSWVYMWQQLEACAAVAVIALTAFRSVFVAQGDRRPGPWQASAARLLRRRKGRSVERKGLHGVAIPHATMTGMRTVIHGGKEMPEPWTGHSGQETLGSSTASRQDTQVDSVDYYQPRQIA